jgi:hypothetical protein
MKQEQIEKAAREFTDNLIAENHFDVNYEEDNYDAGSIHATDEVGVYAFTRGAEWRINSVWHNSKTEVPDVNTIVLVEKEDGSIWQYKVFAKSQMLGWKRWAYIKDLIPNE